MIGAADLPVFYDTDVFAASVAVGGATFPGILDTAAATAFDLAETTTHTLRYQAGALIGHGDLATIDGAPYRVNGAPKRINGLEMVAQLVLQS